MAYMLRRKDGFRLFLDDGRIGMDINLVENVIRSPAMNCRNPFFAGQDEGGRNWACCASLIDTCKTNAAIHKPAYATSSQSSPAVTSKRTLTH
jgi:transposase